MTAVISEVAGTTLFAYVIGALVNIVLNLDPENRLRKQKVRKSYSQDRVCVHSPHEYVLFFFFFRRKLGVINVGAHAAH